MASAATCYGPDMAILFQLSICWTDSRVKMFLSSQRVGLAEGKSVKVGTARLVIITITRDSIYGIPRPRVFFLNEFIKTEIDPNLASSRLQQLKLDALLGSAINDLYFIFFERTF